MCPSNIGFPNTSSGLIFLRRSVWAVVRTCSSKEVFLKISKISKENSCVEIFLNKVTGLQSCNFIKKKLQHRCFCMKFPKFLITSFLQSTSGGYFWELVWYMVTLKSLREVQFYRVVGIIHGGLGFVVFENWSNTGFLPALLENQGKLENHIKFKASQGNSGKVREVFVLKVMSQGKSGKKVSQ